MSTHSDILATLDRYADAYCAKDIDRLMALFDAGDDISVIGTGDDELCSGQHQIRNLFERNFAEATAHRFDWHWTQATIRGDTGVIATTLTIHLDIDGQQRQVLSAGPWQPNANSRDGPGCTDTHHRQPETKKRAGLTP